MEVSQHFDDQGRCEGGDVLRNNRLIFYIKTIFILRASINSCDFKSLTRRCNFIK